jgi:hypothetical protein
MNVDNVGSGLVPARALSNKRAGQAAPTIYFSRAIEAQIFSFNFGVNVLQSEAAINCFER